MRTGLRLLAFLTPALLAAPAGATELKLQLQGLKPRGQIMVLLFSSEQAWKAKAGAAREVRLPVRATATEIKLADLRPGRYGVMVFQDLNLDGKMNFNAVGWPLEPYGFSNNSRGLFGPPAWGKAAFRFSDQPAVHAIRLK